MLQKVYIIFAFILFTSFFVIGGWSNISNSNTDVHKCGLKHSVRDSNLNNLFPDISDRLYDSLFYFNSEYISDGFDFAVGRPNAENYYRALKFREKKHLGEDWNGRGGGNTDLGDPVYATADGLVIFADDVCCGWGNVIRMAHRLPNHPAHKYVETLYAHLHNVEVKSGSFVKRGQRIGTIGNANGKYSAHLHLELRSFVNMSLGPGYSDDYFGYLDPTQFILTNRPQ